MKHTKSITIVIFSTLNGERFHTKIFQICNKKIIDITNNFDDLNCKKRNGYLVINPYFLQNLLNLKYKNAETEIIIL